MSWKRWGRPLSSRPIDSPSSTIRPTGRARTAAATDGSRSVMSFRLRVKMAHLIAVAVDLDPGAVQLPLHRRRTGLGQR